MRRLTHLGGARATVGAGLVLYLLGGDAGRVGLAALLANALSHGAVQVLKRVVARRRPCDANGVALALVEAPDPFSFPSGHAAAAFAVAVPVAVTWTWAAPLALGLALLVAWSRVALRVHWPGDVVAGTAIGVGGATVALQLLF